MEPNLIDCGIAVDDRGSLVFNNNFDMSNIKRFYLIDNFDTNIIRGFHGHLKENKYLFVPQGSLLVITSKIEDSAVLNKNLNKFVISSKKPQMLFIPGGYAHGFKQLEKNTKIIVFSTSNLEESKQDDIRFKWDIFGKEIWETVNR